MNQMNSSSGQHIRLACWRDSEKRLFRRDASSASLKAGYTSTRDARAILPAYGLVMAEPAFPHEVRPSPGEQQPAGLDRQPLRKFNPF